MSFEMSCANCEGRLMVETLGIVVACPHCGTHLSIPAAISDSTDAPPEPQSPPLIETENPPPIETNISETKPEEGQDNPWEATMKEEELPTSFPDFSQGSDSTVAQAASESNVIVSEPETQADTEVPSAVRVTNPDPSAVIPAIVTDSAVASSISGFPVLDDPQPKTEGQETLPKSETVPVEQPIEEAPATESSTNEKVSPNPVVIDAPEAAGEFPGINIGEETEVSDGFPIIDTGASEPTESFPAMTESEEAKPSEGLPTITTGATEPAESFPAVTEGEEAKPSEGFPVIDTGVTEPAESFPALDANSSSAAPPPVGESAADPVGEIPVLGDTPGTELASAFTTVSPPSTTQPVQESPKPTAATPAEQTDDQEESVYDSVFNSRRGKIVPHAVFQAWFSYTILISFGLAWAIYRIFTAQTSNLESLPDIKPLKENRRNYVPHKAAMPPGHTLELGEEQRFGNIEVTPLEVRREKLEIEGWDPEGPVLKLFVKFKNVSDDQTIIPLDGELLFDQNRNRSSRESQGAKANQFVCKVSEKRSNGNVVLVYARLADLDFEFRNQNLGRALKPGEEVTIYIPSETDGLEDLNGNLIWRVHFRKGHSPKNYGVTTVFEVKFHSNKIQS